MPGTSPASRPGTLGELFKRDGRCPRVRSLSYVIYSEAFDRMPEAALSRIYRRIFQVLTGQENSSRYASLTPGDRQAILKILRDTRKDLPEYWKQ